jgi:hypothetical protein
MTGKISEDTDAGALAGGELIPVVSGGANKTTTPEKIGQRVGALGANTPSFSAHKNGIAQTGVADTTFTTITFGTEVYDIGGLFASNGWTPMAGKVHMDAAFFLTGTISAGAQVAIAICKNGATVKQASFAAGSFGAAASIGCDDVANGTDVYTVRAFVDLTSGTGTIDGGSNNTFFCGHWISP